MNSIASGDGPPAVAEPLIAYYPAVSRYMGVSRSTAERIAARGDIPVVRVGRLLKTRDSAIRAFIADAEARTLAGRRRAAA